MSRRQPTVVLPALLFSALALLWGGCAAGSRNPPSGWPIYRLRAEQVTVLNTPHNQRFDASGLLLTPAGDLLTLRNNHDSMLYRIELLPGGREANLVAIDSCFNPEQLAPIAGGKTALDSEGIALDDQGRYYICEERHRWILRCDPRSGLVERLPIDWSSVKEFFSPVDSNASFEGIAIGRGKLYVANERSSPVIIVVDLRTLRVQRHFVVYPTHTSFLGMHYSDLCWFDNKLWVLCRQHQVVLEVDPSSRAVLAEFDYANIESALGYRTGLPVGLMEGLAVDKDSIWLVTDNNGDPRGRVGNDIRPTLVRCLRPDRASKSAAPQSTER